MCWPAKPPYRSFNTNMLTEVYYDWKKLNAPKLDTKTPEKPADGENGECDLSGATLEVLGYPKNNMIDKSR